MIRHAVYAAAYATPLSLFRHLIFIAIDYFAFSLLRLVTDYVTRQAAITRARERAML